MTFNKTIGIDLVDMPDFNRTFINIVCWGTAYQMAQWIPEKTSRTVRDAFSECWIKHYGWPDLIITDQGPEFTGKEFVD